MVPFTRDNPTNRRNSLAAICDKQGIDRDTPLDIEAELKLTWKPMKGHFQGPEQVTAHDGETGWCVLVDL